MIQKLPKTTQKTTQKNYIKDENLSDVQIEILNLMMQNNKITRNEIAEKIGITSEGVKYNLNILKDKKIIKRAGGRKLGYWEIIK